MIINKPMFLDSCFWPGAVQRTVHVLGSCWRAGWARSRAGDSVGVLRFWVCVFGIHQSWNQTNGQSCLSLPCDPEPRLWTALLHNSHPPGQYSPCFKPTQGWGPANWGQPLCPRCAGILQTRRSWAVHLLCFAAAPAFASTPPSVSWMTPGMSLGGPVWCGVPLALGKCKQSVSSFKGIGLSCCHSVTSINQNPMV